MLMLTYCSRRTPQLGRRCKEIFLVATCVCVCMCVLVYYKGLWSYSAPCRSLTEKIVAVLPRMKCPHRIEPHQIQGMDFIHIFPVVQVSETLSFLVKA